MVTLNEYSCFANLTDKPALSKTGSGEDVVNFRIAVNSGGKKNDTKTEGATFVDVEAFAGLARLCAEKLQSGSFVFLKGRLKSTDWDGGAKSKLYLRADNIQFLDFLTR